MWDRIKRLLLPPIFEGDEEKTNQAKLIYYLLVIIIITASAFPLISLLAGASIEPVVGVLVIILIFTALGLGILIRFGHIQSTVIILGIVWISMFTFGLFRFGGLHDTAISGFFFLIILVSVVGGPRILAGFSALSILAFISVYIAEQTGFVQPSINVPSDAADLAMPITIVVASTFVLRIAIGYLTTAYQQVRENAAELKKANAELQINQEELSLQTKELERRTRYLEATATVARDVASELDPETLLRRVTLLVSNQFGLYHTGIFLMEPSGEFVTLRAASSPGGQKMLARGHRLRVGQEGIVGFVASEGRNRIALDTGSDVVYFNNPDLPETRSEAALPLRVRGRVMGVLDVQSVEPQAFSTEDIAVLQTLADQIASALQNAQLFQQIEESLEAQRRAYGEMSREAWNRIINEQNQIGYQFVRGEVISTNEKQSPAQPDLPEISLPIRVGDQVIGVIKAHKPKNQGGWASDEITVMENLSNQLSVALESARLYQDTQQQAAREQLTGEVTSRIRETLDIETILKTTSEEIRKALNLPEVVIRLGGPASNSTSGVIE